MSLFAVFDIAGSGLSAQTLRLNTVSSNLANADSISSSINQTYKARYPVFSAVMDRFNNEAGAAGVRVLGVVESQAPARTEHRPNHPLADEEGNVYLPNVNVIEEMANMISAARSYQNNVEVMNTSKQLLLRVLALGQ